MTPTDIVMDLGAASLEEAAEHTRYALSKQAPSAGQVATNYGMLVLTEQERAELRAWLTKTLELRLAILKTLEGPL